MPKKLNKKVQETTQKIQEKCSAFSAALKTKKNANSNKSNTFNDYAQRTYDFSKLEQALLGNASYEYDDILK